MWKFTSILCLIFFQGPQAIAYDESFPEFITLSELEQAHLDRPSLLGPEYQSDLYSFMRPYQWQYDWLANDVAFDATFGSISPVHFMMDTRAKLRASLNPWLEFRFLHFDERNHDREAVHTVLELVAWPWKKVGFGVYGEPSYNKRENDVGLAVFVKPNDTHEIKIFNTWVDITRQKRNDRTDTFDRNALPFSRGLVGRWWSNDSEKNFLEYALRYEAPSRWNFPDEQYVYSFERKLASVYLSHLMNPNWRFNFKVQADRKFESRSRTISSSTAAEDAFTTCRLLTTVQAPYYGFLDNGVELMPTIQHAHRHWSTPRDTLIYHDYLGGMLVKLPRWFFDYSAIWHQKTGGSIIGHPDEKSGEVNHRLDIGYAFVFNPKAELRLRAGFDLDSFGTSKSWEAGAAQFHWTL